MAFEIKSWKKDGCSLGIPVDKLTDREPYSREINEAEGEGGGLNADYATVEAVALFANFLGMFGYTYGKDFVFKTGRHGEITFDFCDEELKDKVRSMLAWLFPKMSGGVRT